MLGDRYRATHLIRHHHGGRTLVGIDEHRPSKPKCAIKQFFKSSDRPTSSDHFYQVAKRLEALGQHPHIPTLWASFETDQYQYLIQEYLEGVPLSVQLQKHGPFSENKIRAIFRYILPVLHVAHSHQVIHGDICPENMVYVKREIPSGSASGSLSSSKGTGMLVLVGFGVASLVSPNSQTAQTAQKTISSDLQQLGITCIQLLTNESPDTLYDAERQMWQWEPFIKQDVSGSLSLVLDKLLHPTDRHRYQSAEDVLADISRTGEQVSHRPTLVPQAKVNVGLDPALSASHQFISEEDDSDSAWRCIHTLRGHDAWVRSIALSPDGRLLVSGSGDKTVKLWSVADGTLLHTYQGHSTWVRGVAISPDQRIVASVSNDKTVRLWNTQTGEAIQTLLGHGDWIRAVTFLPSDGLLATAGQDKVIHIWDLKRNQILRTLEGHVHWVLALAAHPDGKRLFSGSRDRTIRCWDIASGRCEYTLSGHTSEVTALTLNAQGDRLFSSSGDQTVRIWNSESQRLVQTLRGHTGAVNSIAIHPSGAEWASGSTDKTIKLWQMGAETSYATLRGHAGWVWTVAFPKHAPTPQDTLLASGSWDGTINIWQPNPTVP
ncbi:MAG: WD40 repeat domain-containing serine/threonine-protein kinase [Leptolyngbyaceae bacterium]|nr:WD40 repeat domain-containing serine/threonine-protein kinase [Leptolyngbyaceae bacterium]